MAFASSRPRNTPSEQPESQKKRQAARLLAIKSSGYLISTVSVVLLGVVSWKKASEDPMLMACLLGGVATSIVGMFLRWISYEIEERRKGNGQE